MPTAKFSAATFAYFDRAAAHGHDRAWFEAHRSDHAEHVAAPFADLVLQLHDTFGEQIDGIEFSPRKISRPVRRQLAGSPSTPGTKAGPAFLAESPDVRSNATAFFAAPATSRFEMNPGLYLSFGAQADDNVYGVGLYLPSSRQMKRLRAAIVADPGALEECLEAPALRQRWGGLSGERYQRFPRGFDEHGPGAAFLWQKQFFLGREVTRTQAARRDFAASVISDFALALPFLHWIRETVGVYRRTGES